jgi:hypothetical protein
MKIWKCPTCSNGVRAPQQPRKNDTRRYCLACSKHSATLVERVCPANERKREASAKVSRAKQGAKSKKATSRMTKAFTVQPPMDSRGIRDGTKSIDLRSVYKRFKRILIDEAQVVGIAGTEVVSINRLPLHVTTARHPSMFGYVNVANRGNPRRAISIMAWRLIYLWSDRTYGTASWGFTNPHLVESYNRLAILWQNRRLDGEPLLDGSRLIESIDPRDGQPSTTNEEQAKRFTYVGAVQQL